MISSTEIKDFTYGLYDTFDRSLAGQYARHIAEDVKEIVSVRKNIKSMGVSRAAAFSLNNIIEVVIALVVMATVLPLGIKEFMKAGNDAVLASGTIHAVWVIAPVLVTLGLVLGLIYMALGKNR